GFLPRFFLTRGGLLGRRLRSRTLFLPHVIKNSNFHGKIDPAIGCVPFIISLSNQPLRLHKFSTSHVVGRQGGCVDGEFRQMLRFPSRVRAQTKLPDPLLDHFNELLDERTLNSGPVRNFVDQCLAMLVQKFLSWPDSLLPPFRYIENI